MSLFSEKKKKIIIVAILFSIVFSGVLFPNAKKTQAQLPTVDVPHTAVSYVGWGVQAKKIYNDVFRVFMYDYLIPNVVREIMRQFTLSIVNWIDTGFQGNPSFITDTGKFLEDTADITIGDFLLDATSSGLNFLCDPFKLQVQIALNMQYRPFAQRIKCSLSGALANVDGAMNGFLNGDFINGGGWDSWLQISTIPQNNQMGAMILAQAELDARIVGNKEKQLKEADWSGGFLSLNECTAPNGTVTYGSNARDAEISASTGGSTGDSSGSAGGGAAPARFVPGMHSSTPANQTNAVNLKPKCKITTPGTVLANKIGWADSSDIRQVELGKDFDAVANAMIAFVAKSVIKMGKGLLAGGSDGSPQNSAKVYAQIQKNFAAAQQQAQAQAQASNQSFNSQMTSALNQGTIIASQQAGANPPPIDWSSITSISNSSNGYTNSSGAVNFTLVTTINQALAAITDQLTIENGYLSAQININNLLGAAQSAIDNSICSTVIKSNIDGQINNNYFGNKYLVWNKGDIASTTATIFSNLTALTRAQTLVGLAQYDSQVQNILSTLSSNMNTPSTVADYSAPSGTVYSQITTWVQDELTNASASCIIDKSGLAPWGIQ